MFGYGNITAFDLSNEAVNLFIQQCPPYGAWTHLGATTTDKGGRMKHEINYAAVPIQKTSGQYPIRCVVGGDFSVAAGQVWVLEHGVGGRSLSLRVSCVCVCRVTRYDRETDTRHTDACAWLMQAWCTTLTARSRRVTTRSCWR